MLAIHLLRSSAQLRLVLIERRMQVGCGIAYAQSAHPYLLNVPAARMSADPAAPLEFLEFARGRDARVGAEDFLPRSLYGEYLRASLMAAQAGTRSEFHVVRDDVVAIARGAGGSFEVESRAADVMYADQVALCIGAPPAGPVCAVEPDASMEGYERTAYGADLDMSGVRKILLLGTGLTMADVAIAADAQFPDVVIHAVSRHGLLPMAQSPGPALPLKPPDCDELPDVSLRALFKLARAMADDVARRGGDWRDVVVALRAIAARVWSRWHDRDRRRFLRHIRAHWDVHRHRLPPQTMAHVQRLREADRLHIHAGRIHRLMREGTRVRAHWVARSGGGRHEDCFDRVVNCTGASCNLDAWDDPLVRTLRSAGLISADPLGLGLRTGPGGTVLGVGGTATKDLYYLGPMLRADHWEATATSELRLHAANLAAQMLSQVSRH